MSSVSVDTAPVAPETGGSTRRRSRSKGGESGRAGWLVKLVVAVLCLLWLIPTIGLLITSFRPAEDANSSGWWTVFASPFKATQWTLENYNDALFQGQTPMGISFINSFAVALPATIIPIMIAAFAAYAFTFMNFWGRDALFVFVVGLLVVPNYVAFVPLLQLYGKVGLNGTFPAVWLAHTGFGMPLAIYILRNYMSSLPKAIIESAKIDGASHFTTFWRLIVPMSVPALASYTVVCS